MNQPVSTQSDWLRWLRHGNRPVAIVLMIAIIASVVVTTLNQSPDHHWQPLFDDYSITKNERHRILLALGTAGLEGYRLDQGQVMVRVNEQAKYLAAISENGALPKVYEVEQEFQLSPFMPRSQQTLLETDRRKKQIRDMILRLPFVAEAWFETDGGASGNMFQPDEHSAVVMIQPKEHASLKREQVESIQQLVSSAIVGIKREDVAVIDSSVGITYQDVRDDEQARLIEFVNWRMNRQAHYHQLLSDLNDEYPGIEIEVRVEPLDERDAQPPNDKIAVEHPDKLAMHPIMAQPADIDPVQVGLNSSASVVDARLPTTDAAIRVTSSSAVQTSYQQSFQKLPTTVSTVPTIGGNNEQAARLKTNANHRETVRVTARIPFALVASFQSPELDENGTAVERFKFLKHQLVGRIRQMIPETALAPHQPINVVLMDAPENGDSLNGALAKSIQIYWPVGAILLLGLISILSSRKSLPKPLSLADSASAPAELQETHLQQQLADLIDSDPATAAKVIKSWIRQTN